MGLSVLRDQFENSVTNHFMEAQVDDLSKIMEYCLKYPDAFVKAFQKIPEYKRNGIIDLIEKAKEAG